MKWSLSSLGCYEKCAARYKYRYIDGLIDAPGAAASRGTLIHSTVEAFIRGLSIELPANLALYRGFFDGIKRVDGDVLPEHKLALNEQWEPTDFSADNVWWRGVLDLLIVEPNRLTLYDWKTGKIYDDHDDQKEIYSLATLLHHPKLYEVRAIHVYLDLGKNREKTIHRDHVPALQDKFLRRVNRMQTDTDFIPNPSFMCRYCSFSAAKGGPCRF